MKYLVCLLLSLAAACGTYTLGAVVWCIIDPEGAGTKLLFTIPVSLAGLVVSGIPGLICLVFRCDFIAEPKRVRRRAAKATKRARVKSAHGREDLELALVT